METLHRPWGPSWKTGGFGVLDGQANTWQEWLPHLHITAESQDLFHSLSLFASLYIKENCEHLPSGRHAENLTGHIG